MRSNDRMKPTTEPPSRPAPLLAFGAHPDDLEFGCGAVLVREARGGRPVHLVVGSRGEAASNGTPAQRTREARRAAALLGATIEFADLGGDAHFEARPAHAIKLAAVIRRVRPVLVLAPSLGENQHPDHAVLGRLVRDACRLARYGGLRELRRQPRTRSGSCSITPSRPRPSRRTEGGSWWMCPRRRSSPPGRRRWRRTPRR
jgi:LmbE family N-acetylglucosaminyl deacetylase